MFLKEPPMSCPKLEVRAGCLYFLQKIFWDSVGPCGLLEFLELMEYHFLHSRDFQETANTLNDLPTAHLYSLLIYTPGGGVQHVKVTIALFFSFSPEDSH